MHCCPLIGKKEKKGHCRLADYYQTACIEFFLFLEPLVFELRWIRTSIYSYICTFYRHLGRLCLKIFRYVQNDIFVKISKRQNVVMPIFPYRIRNYKRYAPEDKLQVTELKHDLSHE